MMTVFFTILYALGSMTLGDMLILHHFGGGYNALFFWTAPPGYPSWNYPGLLIVAPWGVVSLPFFATISMVLVSIGVGLGMAVAVLLGVALVRRRAKSAGQPAAVGTLAGLTPAMIALLTLGACCSTTAAATAGVGLVAQVSGSTTDTLLLNNWYLGVFQVAVVWTALVAQELLLRIYGGLFGLSAGTYPATPPPSPPRVSARFLVGGALRVGLLVGGVTWSLAMLVEWTSVAPTSAPAAVWVRWIVEHQLPAFLAILAALFPRGLLTMFAGRERTRSGLVTRGVLLLAGLTLAVGGPPPVAGWGIEGFANELMGLLAVPAGWGAVAPVFSPGIDLGFRWGVQYLLLGGFAIAVALRPARALSLLQWSVGQPTASGLERSVEVEPGTPTPTRATASLRNESSPTSVEGGPTAATAVASR